MNSTLKISTTPAFRTEAEARTAMACGRLPWSKGDKAHTYRIEGGEIIGHMAITLTDVASIDPSGMPVYAAVTESGEQVNVEGRLVLTWRQLWSNSDGTPTAYAVVTKQLMDARKDKELSGHRTGVFMRGSISY